MRKYICSLAFVLSVLVAGCDHNGNFAGTIGAMSPEEINAVGANCSNVDATIAMLQKEKAENDKRVVANVGEIIPVTALARFVTGRYDTNSKIATGEWARMIDRKIAELRTLKNNCTLEDK